MTLDDYRQFRIKCRGIIVSNGELLVVRHAEPNEFYALPGGHLEQGEDPRQCIERELEEELGIKPDIGRLLYVNIFEHDDRTYLEFLFEIKNGDVYRNYESQVRTHAHELIEIRWISPQEKILLRPHAMHEDFKKGRMISDEPRFIRDGKL